MADGFSNSLDVSDLAEDIKREEKAANPYDGLAREIEQQESSVVAAGARWSKQFDPETYAKAAKIAPGVPPEIAARNLKTAEDGARLEQYRQLFDKAPALRSYFAENPKDLAYAHPDELDNLSGVDWALHAAPQAFSSGLEQTQLGYARYAQVAGNSTPENDKLAESLSGIPDRTFGNHGDWLTSGLVYGAQSLPQMGAALLGSIYRGAEGAIAGGIIGAGVGAAVGGVGAIPGGFAGLGIGARVGGTYGALEQNIKIQTGLAYDSLLKIKDENGQPIDPLVARWAALLAGVGQGGLEQLGIAKTLGQVPGLDRLFKAMSTKGMTQILKNTPMREALTEFAKNLGESVSVETLTEVGQQGLQMLAEELAKRNSDGNFEMRTGEDVLQELGQTALQTLQVMTLLGPVVSGTRFAADLYHMQKSKANADRLKQAADAVTGNEFIQRAPDIAAKVIDSQAGDRHVYVPADRFVELYQSRGEDPYAAPLSNWRQRLTEGLATDGDVPITLGEYIAHFASDPKNEPLRDLVRSDPNDYLPDDIKKYTNDLGDLLQSEFARAQARVAEPKTPIDTTVKDEVKRQVTAAGYTPESAEHFATILGAFFNTMADRAGITPAEMAKAYGLQIERVEGSDHTFQNAKDMADNPDVFFQSPLFEEDSPELAATLAGIDFSTGPSTANTLNALYEAAVKGAPVFTGNPKVDEAIQTELENGEVVVVGPDKKTVYSSVGSEEGILDTDEPGAILAKYYKLAPDTNLNYILGIDIGTTVKSDPALSAKLEEAKNLYLIFQPYFPKPVTDFVAGGPQPTPKTVATLPEGWKEIDITAPDPVNAALSNWQDAYYGESVPGDHPWQSLMKEPQRLSPELLAKFDTPEFKEFFGQSQIVDSAGQPLIVYHGTTHAPSDEQRKEFVNIEIGSHGSAFFATNPRFANNYGSGTTQGRVYPTVIRVEHPAGQNEETLDLLEVEIVRDYSLMGGMDFAKSVAAIKDDQARANYWNSIVEEEFNKSTPTGQVLYNFFNDMGRGVLKKQAYFESWSQAEYLAPLLYRAGFDGYYEIEAGSINIAVQNPATQVKSIFNRGTFSKLDGDMLRQDNRGSIQFHDAGAVIRLFEQSDMSTLLHESGHLFLQTLKTLADAAPDLAADWGIVKKHLGISDDNKITREQHEQFARMAEAYFMAGKAPAPELRTAFEKFKNWLTFIYKNIKKLGGRVSPEIAGVFDRMLVTEKRFQEIAGDSAYAPVFQSAADLGLSPEDYIEYQKLVEDLKDQAGDSARGRIVGQAQRMGKGWRKKILKQLTTEFRAKLQETPPYSHVKVMQDPRFSISRQGLLDMKVSPEAIAKFPRGAVKKEGLDPQSAAELLGYPTADDMVYDISQAPPINEAARTLANEEMVRRYGDDFENSDVMDLAIKQAFADEGRLTVLGTEFRALSKKAGRTVGSKGPKQLAEAVARQSLYPKKLKDINERVAQSAARRAASMVLSAVAKGDWNAAAEWKRKQILAQALDNQTQEINRTVRKIRDKAARYTRTGSKSIDPATMEQIQALVTQFEFAKVPLKKLARRESLREYMDKAEAEGLVTVIPDYLLKDAAKTNYKELTAEQLLGFGDTLDNLEHLGRLKHKLKTAKGEREKAAIKAEIIGSIRQRPTKVRKQKSYDEQASKLQEFTAEFMASLLKPEQIIEWLDLGEVGGPLARYVFNQIADAQHARDDLNLEYNTKLAKILDSVPAGYFRELVHISSLNDNMTREKVYAVALNLGNDSNRAKLLEGRQLSEPQIAEILSNLDEKDWNRIQSIWNLLDTLWPRIAALEKRLTGVTPPKIEGREFTNQFGTFPGGYYPIVYDFKTRTGLNLTEDTTPADRRLAAGHFDFNNQFIRPGTNHKYTVARTKVAKPIKLSLSVLPGHIHNVIHDLTHREAVRAAYNILWDPDIKRAIIDVESEAVYNQLTHWLKAVASERSLEPDAALDLVEHIRIGATIYGLAYRIPVALSQVFGFLPALTRVKPQHMLGAIIQMAQRPKESWDFVNATSGELRGRFNAQDRDIKDTVRRLSKSKNPLDLTRQYAFHLLGGMDKFVATVTWLAAYQEQLVKTPGDQDLAVQNGDRVVRLTQGTGSVKDMAKILTKKYLKLFTMFYSFFSAQYNIQVDLTRKTKRDIAEGNLDRVLRERVPQWIFLVPASAILGALITGQGPDDDENKLWWATRKTLTYPMMAVPFIRDIIGPLEAGFDYTLSPTSRFGTSVERALQQVSKGHFEAALKPTAEALAIAFHLPAGDAINKVEALWKGVTHHDFEPQDLLFGRRDKK